MSKKTIRDWQREVHQAAIAAGWWDEYELGDHGYEVDTRDVMSFLANAHGEISEANEEVRRNPPEKLREVWIDTDSGKPEGFGIELADTIIRLFDTASALGINLEEMIEIKHAYNQKRPHRHGGKLA